MSILCSNHSDFAFASAEREASSVFSTSSLTLRFTSDFRVHGVRSWSLVVGGVWSVECGLWVKARCSWAFREFFVVAITNYQLRRAPDTRHLSSWREERRTQAAVKKPMNHEGVSIVDCRWTAEVLRTVAVGALAGDWPVAGGRRVDQRTNRTTAILL